MADATIGIYSFVKMDGVPPLAGIKLRRQMRDGVDGSAYIDVGYESPVAELTTWSYYSSPTYVSNAKMNFKALQGAIVTVTDHFSESWTNIMIEDVQCTTAVKHGGGVGDAAGTTYVVITRWLVRSVALYY